MSSSSSGVTTSTVNGTTRVTGLVSGIDVDSIVEELVTAEKAKKLNQLQQKEQLTEWRQDAYQDIISEIQDFSSKYFDSTSDTCLYNQSTWYDYTVSSSSSAVTATTASDAAEGNHTVSVNQLATSAIFSSSENIAGNVTGDTAITDYSTLSGKSIVLKLDGTDYTVTFGSSVTDLSDVQDAIDDAVGSGKLRIDDTTNINGYLTITAANDGVDSITISAPDDDSLTSGLNALGFGSSANLSNRFDTSEVTLSDLSASLGLTFDSDGQFDLKINGVSVTLDKTDTLDEVMEAVKDADCGATLTYNETSGELVLTADATGAGASMLTVTEGSDTNFLSTVLTTFTEGTDAVATVDGETVTRSSNSFTLDGVTYSLKATTTEDATVSVELDTDGIYDMISDFIEDYNTLISSLNDTVNEDYDTDYPPLTDDQKDDMTDEEITQWEEKAKTGILENDDLLTNFVYDLRETMVDSVSGLSTTIFDLGIDTGDYTDEGQLEIADEDTLKEAISTNLDDIVSLFTQQASDTSLQGTVKNRSLDSEELSTRYNEEGLGWRFYDVLSKYVSTYKDSDGSYGLMIERSGTEEVDTSENYYSKLIDKYEDEIDEEEDRIDDFEDKQYDKYTELETYISNMNTQLTSLQSYLSDS